jgi:hypothetical protein
VDAKKTKKSSNRGGEWMPPKPQLSTGARETGVKVFD